MFRYDNVGESMKRLARAYAILNFVLFVIIAVGLLIASRGAFLLFAIIVLAIGYFISWLSGLMLFAFGELVSSSDDQVALLSALNHAMQSQGAIWKRTANTLGGTAEQAAHINEDGSWVCTCGETNAKYVSTCACGKNKRDIQQS